jgi:hypothetical protein
MAEAKIVLTRAELDALVERAAEEGSKKALSAVGLHDEEAGKDVHELRGLLESWRAVKDTFLRTATKVLTTMFLGAIAGGVGVKLLLNK